MAEKANPIADARLFKDIYVCRNCNAKIRISNPKLLRPVQVRCRNCGAKVLRPKHKELRKLKV
ncbi:MAG: 50S ribosomal protein L40e [Candidatus Parvarchaeota archaeon]|nr:50S ribosomal protein L40e [Candidatus Parvarchaeota archaeon]MCL5101333.1 50S ribosomal protein L40e [Candidatus Parvarchaeota archaeon]